jgi:hypothetical protein
MRFVPEGPVPPNPDMTAVPEDVVRQHVEPTTIAVMDHWHKLCDAHVGGRLEIVVVDRKDYPLTRDYIGELNTAIAWKIPDRGPVLGVMLDSTRSSIMDEVIFTHEVGHYILFLQGFKALRFQPPATNTEILLNSVGHHRPLHAFQRFHGIDPQQQIDDRAQHTLELLRRGSEPESSVGRINAALLLADDLFSCSGGVAQTIRDEGAQRYPDTMRIVSTIMTTARHYDLLKAVPNLRFLQMIAQKLRLGEWIVFDDAAKLRELVQDGQTTA